jgi:hypothetical protein
MRESKAMKYEWALAALKRSIDDDLFAAGKQLISPESYR